MAKATANGKIENIDRAAIAALIREVEEAAQAVAARHGVSIKARGGQFGGDNGVMKFAVRTLDASGKAVDVRARVAREEWKYAHVYGLEAAWLDKTFVGSNGRTYKVAGLLNGSKFVVRAERQPDGKVFKFPAEAIRIYFGAAPMPQPQSEVDQVRDEIDRLAGKAPGDWRMAS